MLGDSVCVLYGVCAVVVVLLTLPCSSGFDIAASLVGSAWAKSDRLFWLRHRDGAASAAALAAAALTTFSP